jgi:hypothetical protein
MPRCQIPILIAAGFSSRLPRYSSWIWPRGAGLAGLSNTLGADFCIEALEEVLARYGRAETGELKQSEHSRGQGQGRGFAPAVIFLATVQP